MNIWGNVKKIFGYIRHPKRLLYPNTYNNERFCEYLRSKGAVIGDGTRFISPSHCVVDPGRIDYISIGKNCCEMIRKVFLLKNLCSVRLKNFCNIR